MTRMLPENGTMPDGISGDGPLRLCRLAVLENVVMIIFTICQGGVGLESLVP